MISQFSDPALRERIAKLIAMLSSPEEEEAHTALRMLEATLTSHGATFIDLADLIVGDPAYAPDSELDEWDNPAVPITPEDWCDLVTELLQEQSWVTAWEKSFLEGVKKWAGEGNVPSPKQRETAYQIYAKARGP